MENYLMVTFMLDQVTIDIGISSLQGMIVRSAIGCRSTWSLVCPGELVLQCGGIGRDDASMRLHSCHGGFCEADMLAVLVLEAGTWCGSGATQRDWAAYPTHKNMVGVAVIVACNSCSGTAIGLLCTGKRGGILEEALPW